jgi:hypothetical protein
MEKINGRPRAGRVRIGHQTIWTVEARMIKEMRDWDPKTASFGVMAATLTETLNRTITKSFVYRVCQTIQDLESECPFDGEGVKARHEQEVCKVRG